MTYHDLQKFESKSPKQDPVADNSSAWLIDVDLVLDSGLATAPDFGDEIRHLKLAGILPSTLKAVPEVTKVQLSDFRDRKLIHINRPGEESAWQNGWHQMWDECLTASSYRDMFQNVLKRAECLGHQQAKLVEAFSHPTNTETMILLQRMWDPGQDDQIEKKANNFDWETDVFECVLPCEKHILRLRGSIFNDLVTIDELLSRAVDIEQTLKATPSERGSSGLEIYLENVEQQIRVVAVRVESHQDAINHCTLIRNLKLYGTSHGYEDQQTIRGRKRKYRSS